MCISAGPRCQVVEQLKLNNIKDVPFPLDYMGNYSLDFIIRMLSDVNYFPFQDYYEDKEDLRDPWNRSMHDKETGLRALHEFPKKQTVEEYQPTFKYKFGQRRERMRNRIAASKKVGILMGRGEANSEIAVFLSRMIDLFPGVEFHAVNVRYEKDATSPRWEHNQDITSEDGCIHTFRTAYICDDPEDPSSPRAWTGNDKAWSQLIKEAYRVVPLKSHS